MTSFCPNPLSPLSLALVLSLVGLAACDSTLDTAKPKVSEQCGQSLPNKLSHEGSKVSLSYGLDRPFVPLSQSGEQSDPLQGLMEYGLQGGHHVDLSLRFNGQLNPDLVDVKIDLQVLGDLESRYYGEHNTTDWYLLYPMEEEAIGCYFHRARIFLFDGDGFPVEALGIEELNGHLALVKVTLLTSDSMYHWQTFIRLVAAPPPN